MCPQRVTSAVVINMLLKSEAWLEHKWRQKCVYNEIIAYN